MKRVILSLVLAASLVPAVAFAGDSKGVAKVTAEEVMKARLEKAVTVFDANTSEFRAKFGGISGAVLLSSSNEYALSELPENKAARIVFYAADGKSQQATVAAQRAIAAGYTNVAVLTDGLVAWKKAALPTSPPRE